MASRNRALIQQSILRDDQALLRAILGLTERPVPIACEGQLSLFDPWAISPTSGLREYTPCAHD